ncbi:MAG: translation initiation factor IF-2 N-terminal domain-containing protein, partial [Longimicrobiaceae bacterium]
MRVYEVAKELGTSSEGLVHLLREMQVPVRSHMSAVADEHVARLRTMIERQRKSGHEDAKEAVEAALEEAQAKPRRRRRKREDIP